MMPSEVRRLLVGVRKARESYKTWNPYWYIHLRARRICGTAGREKLEDSPAILRFKIDLFVMVAAVVTVPIASSGNTDLRKLSNGVSAEHARVDENVYDRVTPIYQSLKKICFLRYHPEEKGETHLPRIYLKDLSSGKEEYLGEGSQADISPEGDKVVFVRGKLSMPSESSAIETDDRTDPSRIIILNLRTNSVRHFATLSGFHNYNPLWSSDGRKIAFIVIGADAKRADIAVLNPSTGDWINISKDVNLGDNDLIFLDSWASDD